MKYIITGLHSSGKMEVARQLEKNGVRVGKLFTNSDSVQYHRDLYECIPTDEMNRVFENSAFIFFSEINNSYTNNYECLSSSEYDSSDAFVLSPNQVNQIPMKALPEPVCFVWMDCTAYDRSARFKAERRQYNFKDREDLERIDLDDFTDKLYNLPESRLVYFDNEDPQRVAAIVECMVKYPGVAEIITKNFKE